MTTATDLLAIDGQPAPANARILSSLRSGRHEAVITVECPKCGGVGRIAGFEHVDDGVCYKCGGEGSCDVRIDLYTPAALARVNARQAAKFAKEKAEREAAAAARRAEIQGQHDLAGAAAVDLARSFEGSSDFAHTLRRWGAGEALLSDRQLAAVVTMERERSTSSHLPAAVGERVRGRIVEFIGMSTFDTGFGTQAITRLRDVETGATLVHRGALTSSAFFLDRKVEHPADANGGAWTQHLQGFAANGERFTVAFTVKAHGEFRGAKQTEVQRIKIERDHWTPPAIEPATVARVIDDPFAGTEFAL